MTYLPDTSILFFIFIRLATEFSVLILIWFLIKAFGYPIKQFISTIYRILTPR